MRILHTSDWHLGRIFHGIQLTSDQAYILDQFINLVKDARPNVVLIAGDIYDRSVPPTDAVNLLDETLSKILLDFRVPVIMIAGNHDSPERLGFGKRLLAKQGLYLISNVDKDLKPIPISDDFGTVYFCPVPYAEPPLVRQRMRAPDVSDHEQALTCLLDQLIARVPEQSRKIALAHAFVVGGEESESERPLSVGGSSKVKASCFHSFHYTALGHLHRPQNAGGNRIRYAGSLLKYSFSEVTHRKSITLVEMNGAGEVTLEEIRLAPRRDVRYLEGYLDAILATAREEECREDYLLVSLKDSGAIFDAVGKLRAVYPNVLHIERPHLTDYGELHGPGSSYRYRSETELFADFFRQVTGEPLNQKQASLLAGTISEIFRQEREV